MIWIRSQKGTSLVEVPHVTIKEYRSPATGNIICCSIIYDTPVATFELGNYSTKEKALKVLDMIQQRISSYGDYVCVGKGYPISYTKAFQMPQNDEVR